jgi:muconate cycloisomerase
MPHLRSLELFHLAVPLKRKIAHASHARTESDNFVVCATLSDGSKGYGEGVPREYVTGENIESCFRLIAGLDVAGLLGQVESLAALGARLKNVLGAFLDEIEDPRKIGGNAAVCALELALLDAYCRRFDTALGDWIRTAAGTNPWINAEAGPVRYSGAITAEGARKERISAWKMRLYGFSHVKVKVGMPGADDAGRLDRFRRILGKNVAIRIDANEAWRADELLDRVRPLLPARPSALEQPLPHAEVGRLAELIPQLGIPVMLDESLCGTIDARVAIENKLANCFNIRLSKCGGVLSSLELLELAHRAKLGVQLGCHPGETGILSAAGRQFASSVNNLLYVEGSYDRHVLTRNVIVEDITFKFGGRAGVLQGPGLGVTVDPSKVEAIAVRSQVIPYD